MHNNLEIYNDETNGEDEVKRNVVTDDEFDGFDDIQFLQNNTNNNQQENKNTPDDSDSEPTDKKAKIESTVIKTRLVSYGADDYEDNDGERDSDADPLDFNQGSDSDQDSIVQNEEKISKEELNRSISQSLSHSLSEEDVVIPPEPAGSCSRRLQEKVERLYDKVLRSSQDMNAMIQQRKDFRNPSIYEKLIEFCGIDEKGTNYPPELFNCSFYGPESRYEELAKSQKEDMDRREKEKKEKKEKSLTIERIQGTKKSYSKWDTVPTTVSTTTTTSLPPPPSSSTNSTNTVQISAVGPLPRQKTIS